MPVTDEQRACIEDTFGVSSAVVAGAGSGKTETLTNRVVFALQHPEKSGVSDIDQILAITYTNKAAAELKSRIKAALERAATPENGLALQALKVDGAWISTIHGMCSRILKENAFTFGVDPAFSIASDEVRSQLLDDALEDVMQSGDARVQARVLPLFFEYRRQTVKELVGQLVDMVSQTGAAPDELFRCAPHADPVDSLLLLVSFMQMLLARFEEQETPKKPLSKSAATQREEIRSAIRSVFCLGEDEDVDHAVVSKQRLAQLKALSSREILALAALFPKPNGRLGPVRAVFEEVGLKPQAACAGCVMALVMALVDEHLQALVEIAQMTNEAFGARKRALGYLDNNDLLALVFKALGDTRNASVAQRYADQFKLVMVDEFQDTNQMQVDMINLVAGGSDAAPSAKLCVVGDAQQSIYRFRNADLAVFQDHVGNVRVAPGGKVIPLSWNFRSHAEILAFVKGVFADVFDDGFLDLLHGRDEAIARERAPYYGLGADVLAGLGESDAVAAEVPHRVNVKVFGSKGNAGVSAQAAASIASDLKTLAQRGNRPGEMAILLGKMTHAQEYAAALQKVGLKCAITGGTVFKKSAEARLVVDLCYALADMHDTQRLADVLTSDLFGLQADDLMVMVSQRPSGKGSLSDMLASRVKEGLPKQRKPLAQEDLRKHQDVSPQLASALHVLSHAAQCVGSRALSLIVEDVLVQSGWLSRLGPDGQARAANAFKAIRMMRDIERESAIGALRLARQLEARIGALKEAPGVLSAKGDDFVRIMTIHASKGLSIPIVAVAEAEAGTHDRSKLKALSLGGVTYLALDADATYEEYRHCPLVSSAAKTFMTTAGQAMSTVEAHRALRTGASGKTCEDAKTRTAAPSSATAASALDAARYYSALSRLNALGDLEEHQRKLYVAYTRAKEALIVAMKKTGADGSKREAGAVDVPHAIAKLLAGDEAANEFCQASEEVRQLVKLHTAYENAEYNLDWEARLEVIPAPDDETFGDIDSKGDAVGGDACVAAQASGAAFEAARCAGDGGQTATGGSKRSFAIPVCLPTRELNDAAFSPQWAQGMFSPSSLKGAQDAQELEPAWPDDASELSWADADSGQSLASAFAPTPTPEPAPALEGLVFDDDDPPAPATDRGTAFHALCEWACARWEPGSDLACPPQSRIDAMARLFRLNARQTEQLPAMLKRWFDSPEAKRAARHAFVVPEQPFWVRLPNAPSAQSALSDQSAPSAQATRSPQPTHSGQDPCASLVMQGFIDLLAYDQLGVGEAYVIDYKTGTRYDTDAKRRAAYELQAKCYAYALLQQGFRSVQLDFFFVDQPDDPVTHFPAVGENPYTADSLGNELMEKLSSMTQ